MNVTFRTANSVEIPEEYFNRITTGVLSLDTLFGDGLLRGSVITLSAKHGTGKTQFALSLLECVSLRHRVGYLSNEESVEQLAYTCRRIGTASVPIANATTVDEVEQAIKGLDVLVIDSFTKLRVNKVSSPIKTERVALTRIISAAKRHKCCVILVTHNTKTGQSKGTSLVQHDVDATLYIDKVEDAPELRKIWTDKNRFGSPNEIYLEMTPRGFSLELKSPDATEAEAPKKTKAQQMYDQTVECLASGPKSAAEVAKTLKTDMFRANNILRELRQLGQVIKEGRGSTAQFSIAA